MSLLTPKKWYKIANSIAELTFAENGMTERVVADKKICVVFHNNKLFACTTKCPHAGGEIASGYVDALGNVVCPLHRYKFSLQNGRNTSGEGYYLRTYPLEMRIDGIYVQF